MSNALGPTSDLNAVLAELAATIDARAGGDPSQSYTAKLLAAGPLKCAKKLGEEATELALALAAEGDDAVASETADLLYHLLVALRARGVPLDTIATALEARQGRSGLEEKANRPKD